MPIPGILQPEVLPIDDSLRLRRYDGACAFALPWYQEGDMLWLIDHSREPYTLEKLERMYSYLDARGELYWIEIWENGAFTPVGDVTFWQDDMPIVIGRSDLRGQGIGRRVVQRLVQRGGELGYDEVRVQEIYHDNPASQRCFESVGFQRTQRTERGQSYALQLNGSAGHTAPGLL